MGKKSANYMVRSKGRPLRVNGTVAREVGMAIVSGALKPGQVLDNEIEAASHRKVSRNTYREAMRMLVAKGLVVSRTRTGTRVSEISEWNVLDPDVLAWTFSGTPRPEVIHALFELRSVVEPAAAALAAARRRPRQLEQMKHALAEMKARTLRYARGARRGHRISCRAAGEHVQSLRRFVDQGRHGRDHRAHRAQAAIDARAARSGAGPRAGLSRRSSRRIRRGRARR